MAESQSNILSSTRRNSTPNVRDELNESLMPEPDITVIQHIPSSSAVANNVELATMPITTSASSSVGLLDACNSSANPKVTDNVTGNPAPLGDSETSKNDANLDITMQNANDIYYETPINEGRFQSLLGETFRNAECSAVSLRSVLDKIQIDVESYGKALPSEVNWHNLVQPRYSMLSDELDGFQKRCLLENELSLVSSVEKLQSVLKAYYLELKSKALTESVLSASNNANTFQRNQISDENHLDENPLDKSSDSFSDLEIAHGLLSTANSLRNDHSQDPDDFDHQEAIRILPEVLSIVRKIASLENLEKMVDIVEKFDNKFGPEAKFEELLKSIDFIRKDFAALRNETHSSFSRINIDNVAAQISSLGSTLNSVIKNQEHLETSLRVTTRWIGKLEDTFNNSRGSNNSPGTISAPNQRGPACHPVERDRQGDATGGARARPNISSYPLNPQIDTAVEGNTHVLHRSGSDVSVQSESSVVKVHERRLKRIISEINSIIVEDITAGISDDVIMDLHSNVMTDMLRLTKECDEKCVSYAKLVDHDESLIDEAGDASAKGHSWVSELKRLYRQRQLHVNSGSDKLLTSNLTLQKFSGNESQTIFEFLTKFEQFTKGKYTLEQKAYLLYSSYLDERIQQEVIVKRNDYQGLKSWLVKKFGRVKNIVDTRIAELMNLKHPSATSSITQKANYFRHAYSILAGIQSLSETSNIPQSDLALYIYTHDTLLKILKSLPSETIKMYLYKLRKQGLDADFFQGKEAYDIFLNLFQSQYIDLDMTAKLDADRSLSSRDKGQAANNKEKVSKAAHIDKLDGVHSVSADSSILALNNGSLSQAVHVESNQGKKKGEYQKHKTTKGNTAKVKGKPWYDQSFKFPCPIPNHSHELGSCADFFSLDPQGKKDAGFRKICYTCFGPRDKCLGNKCINLKKMPTRLICSDCSARAKIIQRSPLNVLACSDKEHTKIGKDDLLKDCMSWFPKFAKDMSSFFCPSVNLVALTRKCTTCKVNVTNCACESPPSYSSPVDPDAEIPIIDTATGEAVFVDDDQIIRESNEESMYIMQLLNLRGVDTLAFFDRGANQHLIEGGLAEKLNLKVLDPRSVPIGVAGAGRIWSEYGMYSVILGPTLDGKYHELKCQGIRAITGEFPHYDLHQISCEITASRKLDPDEPLPKFIGGSRAQLLLGIKDTILDPVTLFLLPSGLGVYKSQLKDKFGSRICVGGPNKCFTEVHRRTGGNFNHISVFLLEMINSYKNSLYPRLVRTVDYDDQDDNDEFLIPKAKEVIHVHSLTVDKELEIDVHPTPLTAEDFQVFDIPVEPISPVVSCKSIEIPGEEVVSSSGVHYCSVFKAKISLDKLIKFEDEDDIDKIVNYRCPSCSKCIKCLQSNRTKAMSLKESVEQDIISRSVQVDMENRKVWVDLPFTKEPAKFLQNFHKGKQDNYSQAIVAYKQQCRKPVRVKDGIRKAQAELVSKGFMKKLTELSDEQQDIINSSAFRHYYPWSSVEKDSVSTPVRLVVDPSRTGLNCILAKGENNMAKIHEILIRNRCKKHIFTSDISKLYNQLHLKDASLPYSLFLFSEELDADIKPTVWVLVRAWYGVRSTGNQSGEALESLAESLATQYPDGAPVILGDRYVDDLLSGSNSMDARDSQISQVKEMLSKGGFSLKFVAKSGERPPEDASSDLTSLKILGYKWTPEPDTLSPGFQELNFNRKHRGSKKPNEFPVVSPEDVTKLLDSTKLSRRIIVSKLSEFYDPVGIWEPYKLQLKLQVALLNGLEWDTALSEDLQVYWKERFKEFVDIPNLTVNRCVIPENAIDANSLRLLCLSDAAVSAGGAAIYAGYKLQDGTYSCQLLTSKSKLMDMSIPRNELSAVLIMSELAFLVKKALGATVKEVLYFTDSIVALSWCHNINKKLKMFTHNRVATIRRFIEWTVDGADGIEPLPLFHIDGTLNIADILTKEHDNISPSTLGMSSEWQSGKSWMALEFEEMSVTRYTDISVSENESREVNSECFLDLDPTGSAQDTRVASDLQKSGAVLFLECASDPTQHCISCSRTSHAQFPPQRCYGSDESAHCLDCSCVIDPASIFVARKGLGIDPLISIVSLGWSKAVRIMTLVIKFASMIIHQCHSKLKNIQLSSQLQEKCRICKFVKQSTSDGSVTRSKENDLINKFIREPNCWLGEDYWFRFASLEVAKYYKSKSPEISFSLKDGIYYYTGRLSEEFPIVSSDLDINVFFDNTEFKSVLPVVLSTSQVFFAYTIFVHDKLRPHSGIELTYREITKKMHVLNNPRRIISKIRRDCIKCRIIFKRTLQLEMASHNPARTVMSPPFHSVQMDVVYKFRARSWKNSRQTFEVYALVIVCILSSATSILVLEGLETQDVVQCLERHSARYGIPTNVFVDSGSQLVSLQSVKFSLRDVDLILYDSLGISVRVSNPKSHQERGRVEAKVKVLRSMLTKLSVNCTEAMTTVSWETLFAKIANEIDNLPLCKGNSSNVRDFGFDIITPNRLKIGRNNYRSLEDSSVLNSNTDTQLLEVGRKVQQVWYQILIDRLHHFIPKPTKWSSTDPVEVGDICIFVHKDSGIERNWKWILGKIIGVESRKVMIEYLAPGKKRKLIVTRNPRQVSKIYNSSDLPVNTIEYYKKNVVKY